MTSTEHRVALAGTAPHDEHKASRRTSGRRLHHRRLQPLPPIAGYLKAFRFGLPPHGAFAIGLERFVAQLCGLPAVDSAPFTVRRAYAR
jgi:hypothetical protein